MARCLKEAPLGSSVTKRKVPPSSCMQGQGGGHHALATAGLLERGTPHDTTVPPHPGRGAPPLPRYAYLLH